MAEALDFAVAEALDSPVAEALEATCPFISMGKSQSRKAVNCSFCLSVSFILLAIGK